MPLGAYFGSTRIVQGSAGLGSGPLRAYADGVVGGNRASAEMPGPLFAYQDGSLGDAPLQAYADGVVGGNRSNAEMPGPLFAYQDGSLGDAPLQAYADGVVGGNRSNPEMPGPLQSYHDGSLGSDDGSTPISVYQDGIFERGDPVRSFGPLQSYHDGSLGAESTPTSVSGAALDLGDPTVLSEVKSLIAMASGGYALSAEGQKAYSSDFYLSGIWEPSASQLWQIVVQAVPAFSGKTVSGSAGDQTFPNGLGISYLYSAMAQPSAGAPGAAAVRKMFPNIAAWLLDAKGTEVLAPYLSNAEKAKGRRGATAEAGMSKMAMWGLGAAALLGVALVLTKKKGYRANAAHLKKRHDTPRRRKALAKKQAALRAKYDDREWDFDLHQSRSKR